MAKKQRSGFAFGKNKGYKVIPITDMERINTGKRKNYKLSEGAILAKNVAQEICGLAPYEKKAIDLIKKGNDKRCKKFLKLRLGNMNNTKKKLEYINAKAME
ncbi:ribosomal protein L36 [Binucleata daphniae]